MKPPCSHGFPMIFLWFSFDSIFQASNHHAFCDYTYEFLPCDFTARLIWVPLAGGALATPLIGTGFLGDPGNGRVNREIYGLGTT